MIKLHWEGKSRYIFRLKKGETFENGDKIIQNINETFSKEVAEIKENHDFNSFYLSLLHQVTLFSCFSKVENTN